MVPEIEYQSPPVVQRTFTVHAQFPSDRFYANIEGFRESIRESFPHKQPRQDWDIKVETNTANGQLLSVKPELRIIHCYLRRNGQDRPLVALETEPGKLTISLHRVADTAHRYAALRNEIMTWLPKWWETFTPDGASSAVLEYTNLLCRDTTPKFVTETNQLQVGAMLSVFAGFPGAHEGIMPPYDCKMGLIINKERSLYSHVRVQGLAAHYKGSSAVRVDLQARLEPPGPTLKLPEILANCDTLHEVVLQQFGLVFTEQAKNSFGFKQA